MRVEVPEELAVSKEMVELEMLRNHGYLPRRSMTEGRSMRSPQRAEWREDYAGRSGSIVPEGERI